MKVICSPATLLVALFLTACSTPQHTVETAGSTPALKITRNSERATPNARRMRANPVHALFDVMLSAPAAPAKQQKPAPVAEKKADEEKPRSEHAQSESPRDIQPSVEQRKAAEKLLAEEARAAKPAPAKKPAAPAAAAEPAPAAPTLMASSPTLPSGGLRMGSILPQEDPASTGDAPPPSANAAERFGLRSPKMPSKLPMGIDGKLKSN